jgi:hypothetical protein
MQYKAWDSASGQPDSRSIADGREDNDVIIVVCRKGRLLDQPAHGERNWHPGFVCEW